MLCLVALALLAAYPAEFYFQNRRLEEWMIYRFVVCYLLGSFGLMLLLATVLTYQMAAFGPSAIGERLLALHRCQRDARAGYWRASWRCLLLLSGVFLWPGMSEYAATGHVALHWSRLLAGAFSLSCGLQTAVFALLLKVLSVWRSLQSPPEELASGRQSCKAVQEKRRFSHPTARRTAERALSKWSMSEFDPRARLRCAAQKLKPCSAS